MTDKSLGVGEIFQVQDKTFKVKIGSDCQECYFFHKNCGTKQIGRSIPECTRLERKDGKSVIFVEEE